MLIIDKKTGKTIEPMLKLVEYIESALKLLGWKAKELAEMSGLSPGEISKVRNGLRQSLTAKNFYAIYSAFGDTCDKAQKLVYPDLDLTLNKYEDKGRNDFGKFMSSFEVIKNSIDIIAAKTGISLPRLKELYYRTGAPEAYELLLIEKALDKKPGEIFEEFFGQIKN